MRLRNIRSRSRLARRSFLLRLGGGRQLISMVNPGELFLGKDRILSSCLTASNIFGAAKSIDGPAESPSSSSQPQRSPVR